MSGLGIEFSTRNSVNAVLVLQGLNTDVSILNNSSYEFNEGVQAATIPSIPSFRLGIHSVNGTQHIWIISQAPEGVACYR